MRILFIGNYPVKPDGSMTGPERPTFNLVRGITIQGEHECFVIIPIRLRNPLAKRTMSLQGKTKIITAHLMDLVEIIKDVKPHIIHVSGITYFGMFALIFSKLYYKIPTVYFAHGTLTEEKQYGESFPVLERIVERILIRGARVVVTASIISRDYVLRHYKLNADSVKVIPYALDERLFQKIISNGNQFRNKYEITESHIILFIARLVPLKGLKILVEACMRCNATNFRLVVIGNNSSYYSLLAQKYPDFFQKYVLRLNTMGPAELAQAYAACSLLVLPSYYEPFGLVALEAMAFAKPVIVSDRVGMGHLIKDRFNGIIIPSGDISALAESINDLLTNDILRKKIGERAQQTAIKMSVSNYANEFIQLYKKLF